MSQTNECILVEKGVSLAKVVLEKATYNLCMDAVQELVTGIAKATGVRIFIDGSSVFEEVLEPVRYAPVEIRFHLLDKPQLSLGKDGFRMRVTPQSIDFDAEDTNGFFNAVYIFLERYCGFLWLWPGDEGEVFDALETLKVPVGETIEKPDYLWRNLLDSDMDMNNEMYMESKWSIKEFHMRPDFVTNTQFKLWQRRNRMGGLKVKAGHTWGEMINPDEYGREHLDYYAEVNGSRQTSIENFDGKHGGQLCTSNPEVLDLLVRKVRSFFDAFPDVDVISISPNDGMGFCECDACIAKDVQYGNLPPQTVNKQTMELEGTFKDDADKTTISKRITGPITDRMFEFGNKIAAKIAETHPDKKLLLLVYSLYRDPPRQVKLADNVIAQYCVMCHQHWDPQMRQTDYAALTALAKMAGELGIYEYYDQGAWPGVTRNFSDLIVDSVRFFHRIGIRYYSTQASTGFAVNGFNLWLLSRVLWDVNVQVDPLLNQYCKKAFKAAADPMITYLNRWRQRWQECKGISKIGGGVPGSQTGKEQLVPFEQLLELYPSQFLRKLSEDIQTARQMVDEASLERKRIDFIARALEGTKILMEAVEFSFALRDRGWPMKKEDVTVAAVAKLGDLAEARKNVNKALKLWARWEAFLETVRNDFVFSFFWARYCYDSRKALHPHSALERIAEILRDQEHSRDILYK